eukprot:scaffold176537_cov17-Tisochrysis_lutea.AAC.1
MWLFLSGTSSPWMDVWSCSLVACMRIFLAPQGAGDNLVYCFPRGLSANSKLMFPMRILEGVV